MADVIAFFGMGLLGSNFVRALRRRGHEVRVWNRTESKARALEEVGAKAFTDPAEVARGASRIHLTLSEDSAVDDVLERARPGFGADVLVMDHTTTSPTTTRARVERWQERGVRFVHTPVFMGPANALESSGVILFSGAAALKEAARPFLEPMTGKVVDVGDEPEAAASFKLLGNLYLMFLTTGLSDLFMLGKALGIPAERAVEMFEFFNPGSTIGTRAARMISAPTAAASWELGMARKDARLMLEEAARAGKTLAVLPAIAARMDAVIAEGHAHSDWTVLGKDAL